MAVKERLAETMDVAKNLLDHLADESPHFEGGLTGGRQAAREIRSVSPAEAMDAYLTSDDPSDLDWGLHWGFMWKSMRQVHYE
ncbi:MAG: hypothetical protein U5L95_00770 [Candidatus Saccharibacteria bacterium]|nr:hypothetical protein [Candidatus Saccharibacteria bacterium]